MSQITTHILDTSQGKPAEGVLVILKSDDGHELSRGVTNADGRISDLTEDILMDPGTYSLSFDVGTYFNREGIDSFYPSITILFTIKAGQHYHVPLLLNPFGYSTYRGS